MVELICGARKLKITPYEREKNPDDDWINVWIEFSAPELKTKFKTAFTAHEVILFDKINIWVEFSIPVLDTAFKTSFRAGELKILRNDLDKLYHAVQQQKKMSSLFFTSVKKQVAFKFQQVFFMEKVIVYFMLRPEEHSSSAILRDSFGIDESYFPALLSGLDEMINWQN